MASDGAAKEILGFAKNRLNKFYNPKLYKAPPKRKLSEEEQITLNMGGTLAPTAAPGGIAGTGVTVLASVSEHKAAPPPPPETAAAVSGGGGGAALCSETEARTVTPVPAMPPGAAVGAKVPPMLRVICSSSESLRFGGALYNFGL